MLKHGVCRGAEPLAGSLRACPEPAERGVPQGGSCFFPAVKLYRGTRVEFTCDAEARGVQRGGAPRRESEGVPQNHFLFLPHEEGSHTTQHKRVGPLVVRREPQQTEQDQEYVQGVQVQTDAAQHGHLVRGLRVAGHRGLLGQPLHLLRLPDRQTQEQGQ